MIWLVLAAAWIICGTLAYGGCFAYFQRGYPTLAKDGYWEDFYLALFMFILGPWGLSITIILGQFKHGFKWS